MPDANSPFIRLLSIGLLGSLFLFTTGSTPAVALNIEVHDSRIDIQTEDAPLFDALNAISKKTGISFKACLSSSEPATLETCLRRALSKGNYAIIYKKMANGEFAPVEIRLFGQFQENESDNTVVAHQGAEGVSEEPTDPMRQYNRSVFIQAFSKPDELLEQISVDRVEIAQHPNGYGLQITSLDDDSVFKEIGLQTGDIVMDVNGKPVKTVGDIVRSLRASGEEGSSGIRLERLNANGDIHPIYIELH